MSSRARRSWLAFRSDGRIRAFVLGSDGGRVRPKAVGKPDKTTISHLVRKYLRAPGKIARAGQSRLENLPLQLNSPDIANLPANMVVAVKRNSAFVKAANSGKSLSPIGATATALLVSGITIVARFDPRVVIFLFHGRNSGQQKGKENRSSGRGVGQRAANLGRRALCTFQIVLRMSQLLE
jgi:hypothetical protein